MTARLLRLLLALVTPGLAPSLAQAAELRLDLLSRPLPPLAELVLRGVNRTDAPALLVLRIDDAPAPAYADRVNAERLVPPGPFTLRLRLALLATPRGRAPDLARLRQAIAFVPDVAGIALDSLVIEAPPALPPGLRGWSFAPEGAAPLAGFEAIAAADPRLSGPGTQRPRPVRRPGGDALLARGMAGITRFATPLPPGAWRITLWTEDPGEWETLPPLVEHRIRVNGQDLLQFRRSAEDWVRQRYLAGQAVEPTGAEPPFESLGARRGGRVGGIVTIGAEGLVVELAGHPQAATHLAAILAEPAEVPPRGAALVEALRAARFAEDWPVLARPAAARPPALTLTGPDAPVAAAPGGLALLRFEASGPGPMPLVPELVWDGRALPTRLLWGQWRWRRPAPETPGLVLSAAHLRAEAAALALADGLPRPLLALVTIPPEAPPGRHRLRLRLASPGRDAVEALATVEVLPVRRPAPRARVGVWLDWAPHLATLPETAPQARRQAGCDLETLAGLGLTAIAPPLATPADAAGLADFLADLGAAAARFPAPILAYAPLRRLRDALGPAGAAQAVVRAEAAAAALGLPAPVWTLADEPSGSGTAGAARALALALREAGSTAALAGHLNDPEDAALLPLLALASVNPRYGADAADVARLRRAGSAPWLYNMPRLRLGGGFHLWRSGAEGLLQWHARMPTADAFDPTDGREGDVQFLWPMAEVCAPPDLDAELLELAEAAEDLRWLAWLEAAAAAERPDPTAERPDPAAERPNPAAERPDPAAERPNPAAERPGAAALLARLRREVPERWAAAAAPPPGQPGRWRDAITALAR